VLKLGSFPVTKALAGPKTRWHDGTLEVNIDEIMGVIKKDERIAWASVDLVNPGDGTRIINEYDIVEPRIKTEGPGQTYPSIVGRRPDAVGEGTTFRLEGCSVVACVDISQAAPDDPGARARAASRGLTNYRFIDKSGPGAVTFSAPTASVCVTIEQPQDASSEYWHTVAQGAVMRVVDRLAQTVVGLKPPKEEIFDITPKSGLPGVVWIPHLSTLELYRGPYTKVGMAVYGITRAAPPWVLDPRELLDGAISQVRSWIYTNNPTNLELLRRHGTDWNYLACLAYPTNWSMESEKQSVSSRVARIARMLGAQGALVTTDVRGQRMVETMLTVQACEQAGLKTVFLSEEEDPEEGTAPPFLNWVPELEATVSTGTGGWDGPFPPVKKVIGARSPAKAWFGEQPPVHGRYGVSHLGDHYGYGKQSYADF